MKRFCLKRMTKSVFSLKKSSLLFPIFTLSLVLFVISCKYEPNDLGFGLIPGQDNLPMSCDSSIICLSQTILKDSIIVQERYIAKDAYDTTVRFVSSLFGYNILGEYKDPVFGRFSSSLLFRLVPSYLGDKINKAEKIKPISLTLYLIKSDSVILGSKADLNFEVFKLNSLPKDTGTYYSFKSLDAYYSETDKVLTSTTYSLKNDTIKIEIKDTQLAEKLLKADSIYMRNDTVFAENIFKGFYIRATTPGTGSIAVVNPSNTTSTFMTLKYLVNDKDTLTFNYNVYEGGISFYSHDYALSDPSRRYIQGLSERSAQIDLKGLDQLRNLNPVSINKAVLFVYPDSDFLKPITRFEYPRVLDVVVKNETGSSYISNGGIFENGKYSIDITKYIQSFLKNNTIKNSITLKARNDISYALKGQFDAGRMAFKENGGLKLKVFYTKIK
jgi:hypothetical protein